MIIEVVESSIGVGDIGIVRGHHQALVGLEFEQFIALVVEGGNTSPLEGADEVPGGAAPAAPETGTWLSAVSQGCSWRIVVLSS